MEKLIKIVIISLASFSLVALSHITKSDFVEKTLFSNAFIISIAIFTIHASASTILISQLNILNKQIKIDFTSTLNSIKNSFIEDALIIFFVLLVSILHGSTLFEGYNFLVKNLAAILLIALLAAQLWIIYDILIAILNAFRFGETNK